MRHTPKAPALLAPLLVLALGAPLSGYSVLSHEAIVDAAWRPVIRPLLLARYPAASDAQLREAHAYAYGGCVIQDMGYYPFGNHFFSDLTHYVRTGDFVQNLLGQSGNMYEYAFALGALAHYAADDVGHPLAVNLSVPEMYPHLQRKYGKVVTYEDDPKAHIMVEFSFDVAQIAGAGYLPRTYENFIGFKVATPVLERAFKRTYGLSLKDLFLDEDLAIGTYRRGASEVIPRMTQIAWKQKKREIRKANPGMSKRGFVYRLSRANYEREWGARYRKPSFVRRKWREENAKVSLVARLLIFLASILPKVGPLRTLSFKPPSPETQRMFVTSFTGTVTRYQQLLAEVQQGRLSLEDKDLDTGLPTRMGAYGLADKTYARLLDRLADDKFQGVDPDLRSNILSYYSDLKAPNAAKKDPEEWQKILRELEGLRAAPARPVRVATRQVPH